MFGCSQAGGCDEFVRTELKCSDSEAEKNMSQKVFIEDGCSFENDDHKYHVQDGKLFEYNAKKDKWEKVDNIKTTVPQAEIFKTIASMNDEKTDGLVLSIQDIKDAQDKNPKELFKDAKFVSCGVHDIMVFHKEADESENQLVFRYDNSEK